MPAKALRRILAVDGGGSKTDVVIADESGRLLGAIRVRLPSHFGLDHAGAGAALGTAVRAARKAFSRNAETGPLADVGVYSLAGADLPIDERRIHRLIASQHWSSKTMVRNDTLAVLRAGTDQGWGVAVVCGSGMNAIGVGPSGDTARFLSYGDISGDLAAGGGFIGLMALAYGVRAEDGRGQPTRLASLVSRHFKRPTASAVAEALYQGEIEGRRLMDLAPLVFTAAAAGDPVARGILDRVADEVVAFARAAIDRLGLARRPVPVVLGGGIFRAGDPLFQRRIARGIRRAAPRAVLRRLEVSPVLGTALIGLDQLHAGPAAVAKLRAALIKKPLG